MYVGNMCSLYPAVFGSVEILRGPVPVLVLFLYLGVLGIYVYLTYYVQLDGMKAVIGCNNARSGKLQNNPNSHVPSIIVMYVPFSVL
jgi:hypothetical protein